MPSLNTCVRGLGMHEYVSAWLCVCDFPLFFLRARARFSFVRFCFVLLYFVLLYFSGGTLVSVRVLGGFCECMCAWGVRYACMRV